jgi:uncharacterized protein (DUF1778 family)
MVGMTDRRKDQSKGSPQKKEALLQLRLSAAEKEAFEDAARLAGLALSAWVRSRLRSAARRELIEEGQSVAFLNQPTDRGDDGGVQRD